MHHGWLRHIDHGRILRVKQSKFSLELTLLEVLTQVVIGLVRLVLPDFMQA